MTSGTDSTDPAARSSAGMAHTLTGAVRLARVSDALAPALAALRVAPGQENFLADNAASLDEARHDPDARPRAILAGETPVGFLMYEAPEHTSDARLYRFMIDAAYQGQGFGRAALAALLAEIAALGHIREVSICYMPENEGARRLYASAGFIEDGLDEDGEMIARRPLDARPPA